LSDTDLYTGREQTLVKHFILRHYLARFAIIVGHRWDTITYVDCFSGPWNVQSDRFEDSSFAIALDQLRKASEVHQKNGRPLKLRCFFLEKKKSAFLKLKQFTETITDAEIEAHNSALENSVPLIEDFVRKGGRRSFPFIFVDPTGWTGFDMAAIAPLLRLKPGEVLINFMTGHIRRFIDSPQQQTQQSFVRLFGSPDFKTRLIGLTKRDREDATVQEYSRNVKQTGSFTHTSSAIVLHPEKDRTHFHLIYATRNAKGVEVFKEAEKKAMPVMQQVRGEAHKRKREETSGQIELSLGDATHDPTYYNSLRARYIDQARASVSRLLHAKGTVPYDEIWSLAMTFPMVWESDLHEWLHDWKGQRFLEMAGLRPNMHIPKREEGIFCVWQRRD
jgi:three-Cys-motif partner protein